MTKFRWKSKLYSAALLAVFFVLWQVLASRQIINTFLFSSPLAILKDIADMFSSGYILPHIWYTLKASALGLLLGTALGVAIAFLFGQCSLLAEIFDPIFVGLNGLPKLSLGPLLIVWFGIGIKVKIFMSAIMVFFLVFFNAYAGFKNIDVQLTNTLRLMGATRLQSITKVVLPSCVPWIMASLRSGVGTAVLGAIVGEYLGSTAGLGYLVQAAGGVFNITRVLSCIFVLMIIMSILDALVKLIERSVLRWRQKAN